MLHEVSSGVIIQVVVMKLREQLGNYKTLLHYDALRHQEHIARVQGELGIVGKHEATYCIFPNRLDTPLQESFNQEIPRSLLRGYLVRGRV